MSKVFKNIALKGYDGKTIQIPEKEGDSDKIKMVDAKVLTLFYILLNNAPFSTQNDSIQGVRLAEALDAAKKNGKSIEIEEGVHDWLKPIAEKVTPQIFRINGNIVYNYICEGFEKPHEKGDKNN